MGLFFLNIFFGGAYSTVESTALSKCFAKQGIKIPIRKEPRLSKSKKGPNGDGSESEEEEDGEV